MKRRPQAWVKPRNLAPGKPGDTMTTMTSSDVSQMSGLSQPEDWIQTASHSERAQCGVCVCVYTNII